MAVLTPGLRLSDRYLLDHQVGEGGMSQLWLAHDEVLSRPVAVKALDESMAADPALLEREARAAASICHPNVTQVYDFGERPVPYLVMELLEGEDLGRRLARGPLPWPEAVRLTAEVAGAIAAAHATGVVHGDIKPATVMLTAAGAKVVDFGISAWSAGCPDTVAEAEAPPCYVAPEVFAGEAPAPAADVYALGAVLYAALTGTAPAEPTAADLADPAVEGLPGPIAGLCQRCLDPSPSVRPTSAEAATVLRAAVRRRLPLSAPTARPHRGVARPVPARPRPVRPSSTRSVRRSAPVLALVRPRRRAWWRLPAVVGVTTLMLVGLMLVAVAAFAGRPIEADLVAVAPAAVVVPPVQAPPVEPAPLALPVAEAPPVVPPVPPPAPVAADPAPAVAAAPAAPQPRGSLDEAVARAYRLIDAAESDGDISARLAHDLRAALASFQDSGRAPRNLRWIIRSNPRYGAWLHQFLSALLTRD